MADFHEDPSVLTKEKLKSELMANNVPLPSSEQKKDAYVHLYLKNLTVLNKRPPPPVDTFSSDEESPVIVVSNRSRSGRKATRKTDKPRSEEVEVTDLTDAGLKEELLKQGVNAGPIVGSTRKLYEKKLQNLLDQPANENPPNPGEATTVTGNNQNGNTHSDQYSDKEDDDITGAPKPEPVPVVEKPVRSKGKTPVTARASSRRSHKPQQVVLESLASGDQTRKKTGENVEEILANEILSPTGISATCRRPIRGAAGRPVQPGDYWLHQSLLDRSTYTESHSECSSVGPVSPTRPGFLSLLLRLMVLIILAGSIYFIIEHLDEEQLRYIKGLPGDASVLLNDASAYLSATFDTVVEAVVNNVVVPLGIGSGGRVGGRRRHFATEGTKPPVNTMYPNSLTQLARSNLFSAPLFTLQKADEPPATQGLVTKHETSKRTLAAAAVADSDVSCEFASSKYYALCGFGGILSCGITHTAVVPLDLVKCRLQVDPNKYKSIFRGFSITIKEDGMRGLAKGWAPTFIGYSMQGLCKFGFYEVFKTTYGDLIGEENSYLWRTSLYLAASASAEFFADIALAPMEACKVRIQTQPGYANTLRQCAPKMYAEEGLWAFYKGVVPLWMRQIPYTMMKFACFERTVEMLYKHVVPKPRSECSKSEQLVVTFVAGYIAGVFCAIVSHPADSVVSVLNKESGSSALGVLKKLGPRGVWKGLVARIIMIGTLTALQWFIYDSVKVYFRLPRPPPPEMPESLKKKLGLTE
ncbi:hypothetical protein DPEC_G00161130 [Dallia pectoralis]|uniref:Uncharacterized protein n=1 Tax=Dallia pectoralis TaxID=75939 RepID=A0ACC2GFY8_DALPE|nr:hypothetical protein DPEC_G00161130 [Dallia pectoralis]